VGERPYESWRSRAAVSEALEAFNSSYLNEIWGKALARRESDPEGAVTSARTLLESVCKHILEDARQSYNERAPLPELHRAAAAVLQISPNEATEKIFTDLFTGCAEVIRSIGNLRNYLSDAHGRGPFGKMPDWRHAELAVNISGAMAIYMAAIWKGRQPTVADVLRQALARLTPESTQRYTLDRMARHPIGDLIASKLQVSDIVAYAEERRTKGALPQTINQDVVYLRSALGDGLEDVFDEAGVALRGLKLVGKSIARNRRPTHGEYDALINLFREQDQHPKTIIAMAELMDFAMWSGRSLGEICRLKWSDVDFNKRTCKLQSSKEPFLLLERAWDIIQSRSVAKRTDERIFPYHRPSVSQRFMAAKKQLAEAVPSLKDLRLQDLRYEAVNRLLEKSHPPHTVARATGMSISKVEEIHKEIEKRLDV
jgi:integrase